MSAVRKVAKNTTVLFISQIITYVIGFFIAIKMGNYLGPLGFGIIQTALALTAIYGVFTDLGLGTLTVREVSRDNSLAKKYVANTTVMKIILAVFTFLLIFLTVNVVHYPKQEIYVIYIITASVLFNSFSGVFYSIFQSYQEMEFQSLAAIVNSILMLIGVIILIFYNLSVIAFAYLYLIANAVVFVYALIFYVRKFELPKIEVDYDFWRPAIMAALPLSIVSIFSLIAYRIDTVLLSILKTSVQVGYYSASYNLMMVFLFLPGVFTTAIFPVFSNFFVSSEDSLKYTYKKSFKYFTILSLPIAVGISLLSPQIIHLIYPKFLPSILILQILIWSIPITFLNYIFGTIIPAMNRQNLLLKITFISMTVNISLNLLLIPTYSYIGAAVVTIITELVVFILCFYILSRSFCKINLPSVIFKPAIASIVMALFIIKTVELNLFLDILIATIIYFAVIIALKTFTDEDYAILKEIINLNKIKEIIKKTF
ncbi:MAG: flippase [Methanobacterium sp.]|jgi:O-antigen/teichoic acid export membrane protein